MIPDRNPRIYGGFRSGFMETPLARRWAGSIASLRNQACRKSDSRDGKSGLIRCER